jgi:hypothetical protein
LTFCGLDGVTSQKTELFICMQSFKKFALAVKSADGQMDCLTEKTKAAGGTCRRTHFTVVTDLQGVI